MPRPVIAFSHANGFPAGTYRQLFKVWQDAGYRVISVERYGHDPAYPVSSNWPRLRDQPELRTTLYQHACEGAYGAPEYGGNPDLAGWRAIEFEGDVQPRGYTDDEVTRRA